MGPGMGPRRTPLVSSDKRLSMLIVGLCCLPGTADSSYGPMVTARPISGLLLTGNSGERKTLLKRNGEMDWLSEKHAGETRETAILDERKHWLGMSNYIEHNMACR